MPTIEDFESAVPGLDPTFYHTLSYEGDIAEGKRLRALANARATKATELRAALSDLLEYAQLASQEMSDPGTGLLCAIHNAKQILNETQ